MGGKTSAASKNRYNRKTYDRIIVIVHKGEKDVIMKHAKSKGYEHLSKYVNDLITADMEKSAGE